MVLEALSITVLVYGNILSNNLCKVALFLSGIINRGKRQKSWQHEDLFIFSTYFFQSSYSIIQLISKLLIIKKQKIKKNVHNSRYR